MNIQQIGVNNQTAFGAYRDLSSKILKSDRESLINLAEYFHTASDVELKEISGSNSSAMSKLKSAIAAVITRKKCYIADGASFCKKRAEELDNKAQNRGLFYKA